MNSGCRKEESENVWESDKAKSEISFEETNTYLKAMVHI